MISVKGYAAHNPTTPLAPWEFNRRDPGVADVLIEILHCGVCHSDIHQVRNEWGNATYPMVPGHEIVGRVMKVGNGVKNFKEGDLVGVGCFVDSCRSCPSCKEGLENYCENHLSQTYNGTEQDKQTLTQGGYSARIVVDENYVLKIPANLDPAGAAPLLCAGITTYSPLRFCKVGKGHRVAVAGLGGLGHLGVKFAAAFGAEVTVLSTTEKKREDAKKLGAREFLVTTDASAFQTAQNSFDFLLDTIAAPHDLNAYCSLLKRDGTLMTVGAPSEPLAVHSFSLIFKRRKLMGSLIGGIRETQEMLDFCGKNNIVSEIESVAMKDINTAFDRTIRSDVKYRFVIDMKTL